MDWGASRILALRKHASMTQAQFSQWLGVTIKQVKYLEHERRKPSGPTRRLLEILARQLKFGDASAMQVLGASPIQLKNTAPAPEPQTAPANPDFVGTEADEAGATPAAGPAIADTAPSPPAPNGNAFVWL